MQHKITTETRAELDAKIQAFDAFVEKGGLDKKPHQRAGVQWMLRREILKNTLQNVRGGLIADEMGLGKTIQVIGIIISNFKDRTLVVLPLVAGFGYFSTEHRLLHVESIPGTHPCVWKQNKVGRKKRAI